MIVFGLNSGKANGPRKGREKIVRKVLEPNRNRTNRTATNRTAKTGQQTRTVGTANRKRTENRNRFDSEPVSARSPSQIEHDTERFGSLQTCFETIKLSQKHDSVLG